MRQKFLYLDYKFKNRNQTQLQKDRTGILSPKLFWPTVRKNCSSDREKLLKFEAEGREFAKKFWPTVRKISSRDREKLLKFEAADGEFAKTLRSLRTIYSKSERSEELLVTECFF